MYEFKLWCTDISDYRSRCFSASILTFRDSDIDTGEFLTQTDQRLDESMARDMESLMK